MSRAALPIVTILLAAACGGAARAPVVGGAGGAGGEVGDELEQVAGDGGGVACPPDEGDARVARLCAMATLLTRLADEVTRITTAERPSAARCARLAAAVTAWVEASYDAFDDADTEGASLGIKARDAGHPGLVPLARALARASALLIDRVDQDCLYGDGDYGDLIYEHLLAYQGLVHWVQDGDPRPWAHEALVAAE